MAMFKSSARADCSAFSVVRDLLGVAWRRAGKDCGDGPGDRVLDWPRSEAVEVGAWIQAWITNKTLTRIGCVSCHLVDGALRAGNSMQLTWDSEAFSEARILGDFSVIP